MITFVTPLGNAAVENVRRIAVKNGHRYVTLVMDLDSRRILHVGEGRGEDSLSEFWKKLGRRKKQIAYAAADLSPAYTKAVREDLLNSVLVCDRFHIMQMLHRTITDCRRAIYRKLPDETARRAIKGSRFVWQKDAPTLTRHVQELIVSSERPTSRGFVSWRGSAIKKFRPRTFWNASIYGAANEPRFRALARKRNQKFLESA